jgi:hypothetical protein
MDVTTRSHPLLRLRHKCDKEHFQMQKINAVTGKQTYQARVVAYWIVTFFVAFELVASSIWAIVGTEYVNRTLTHLGYPFYIQKILGIWDFPAALTILFPNFQRLKEWAYAGAFFKFTGATASHIFAGDGPAIWMVPLSFALLTLGSWALRPPDRKMIPVNNDTKIQTREWVVPIVIIVGLLIISLFTVPK